jgi:hypothetical protein
LTVFLQNTTIDARPVALERDVVYKEAEGWKERWKGGWKEG